MPPESRIAVADLGTNSTRLLVADVTARGALTELERRSEVTRLGDGVDATGRLSGEAVDRVLACLARYREVAGDLGAQRRIAVATSAVRDSANGDELQERVRSELGFDIRTISGDEEARLTFLGATAGRDPGAPTLVVDIGGGSTEYVAGEPASAPSFHVSTRLGSVRQTERHLKSDPPAHAELEAMATAAREIIEAGVPPRVRGGTDAGIAVAGTATQLAAVDQQLEPYDSSRVHGYRLLAGECERILARLAALPAVRAPGGAGPGSRPRPHDRGRGGDPGGIDAPVRARLRGGQRGGHPAWSGHRRNGSLLTPFRTRAPARIRQPAHRPWVIVANTGSWGRLRGAIRGGVRPDSVHRFGRSRIVSAPPAVRTARPLQGTYPCPS